MVPFVAKNVELDFDAYRELMARGFRTVPVTLIGDDPAPIAVTGFDEAALRRALGLPPSDSPAPSGV